jgi:hypothetical protein
LTALNFTEYHPQKGIPADWDGADYVIEEIDGIFRIVEPSVSEARTPSQAVFRVESTQDPSTIWVTESPLARRERLIGAKRTAEIEQEYLPCFTSRSLSYGKLVHRDYNGMQDIFRVKRSEVGRIEESELLPRLNLSHGFAATVEITEPLRFSGKSHLIYRAKYKIAGRS